MDEVVLRSKTEKGETLEATFLPGKGMNLVSFRKGDLEVIDQNTRNLFDERYAGLGALIGPHFHRRPTAIIPPIKDESLFPHIARVKAKGVQEPFSHGIARYAPWQAESTENMIRAQLKGSDEWNGVPLKELEGQDFTIDFVANLSSSGLHLKLNVRSDTDSLMGLHYYYRLPEGEAKVESDVTPEYCDQGEFCRIPKEWGYDAQRNLSFDLERAADYGFRPNKNPLNGVIHLRTSEYTLRTNYQSTSEENSWQLFRPEGSTYVCIEPMSASNPRKPRLSVSGLEVELSIMDKEGS